MKDYIGLYRNIKNQKLYKLIDSCVVNSTNNASANGSQQLMVLYKDERGTKYVREREEFMQKFVETDIRNWQS